MTVNPPGEGDTSNAALSWRLSSVEREVHEIKGLLTTGLTGVESKISGLQFVRADVYASHREAQEKRFADQDQKIDNNSKQSQWALGLVCSLVLFGLFGLALAMVNA